MGVLRLMTSFATFQLLLCSAQLQKEKVNLIVDGYRAMLFTVNFLEYTSSSLSTLDIAFSAEIGDMLNNFPTASVQGINSIEAVHATI